MEKGATQLMMRNLKKRSQQIVLPGAKHAQYAKTEQIKLSFHYSSLALIYHEVQSVPADVETEADIPI